MNIELGKSWGKKLQHRIERYNFEVGVLEDKPHKDPVVAEGLFAEQDLITYAGGPVRRTSRQKSDMTNGQVLVENMKRLNINLLLRPFQEQSSEIMKFTKYFLQLVTTKPGMKIKRIENLLQAIVRNPILKQEYGSNTAATADAKGFDRHLFDTGQMFKSIKARVIRV